MKFAFWGIILLFISLFLQYYFSISINDSLIILSIVCIIIQFIAIYWDSTDYAYTSKNIFDTSRDLHWNARMLYLINGVILILSLLYFFNFYEGFYNMEALIWGLSAILTFIAAISAKPPIRREQTSKISMKHIENIVYNYLKDNKGSAFTVCALGVRLENFVQEYKARKLIRKNLEMILDNLITRGKIGSSLYNEELHYFAVDVYQKKAEELPPITSIPEEKEEAPEIASSEESQQVPLISELPLQEVSEKVTTEVTQLKTEELEPVPSIPEKIEEAPKVASSDELQQVPPISELLLQEVSEKVTTEVTQLKTEELEPVPSIPEEKEKAPKEFSYTCKFCGMKLTKKANTCPQCGTIIKP